MSWQSSSDKPVGSSTLSGCFSLDAMGVHVSQSALLTAEETRACPKTPGLQQPHAQTGSLALLESGKGVPSDASDILCLVFRPVGASLFRDGG